MTGFDSFSFSLAFPVLIFLLCLIILGTGGILYYRRTVPELPAFLKYILMGLRLLVLIIVLTVLFEPVAKLIRKEILKPVNLIFVDNSRSMLISEKDYNRKETAFKALEGLKSEGLNNSYFVFGSKLEKSSAPEFKDAVTDFGLIYNELKESKQNISSVVIISDGVITRGSGSFRSLENLNIPFYTILTGDSTTRKDIRLSRVTANDLIYAGVSTPVITDINAEGFDGSEVKVQLLEENTLLQEKSGTISNGALRIKFDYLPASSGEKKLTVRIIPLKGEVFTNNNLQTVYVNVLSGKIKINLVCGSPSGDISAVVNSLSADTNFFVRSIVHIGNGKYIPKNFNPAALDSSEILILLSFPEKDTPQDLLNKIVELTNKKNIPFLFLLTSSTDINRLSGIMPGLPVEISGIATGITAVQATVNTAEMNHPILGGMSEAAGWNWSSLPPLSQPGLNFKSRAGSTVLLYSSVRNVRTPLPLFGVMRNASKRSAAITAGDLWRWKLNQPEANGVFENFLVNTVKWLNAVEDRKQVKIKPVKKLFAASEPVEFTAEVYDESFNPVSGASVSVEVRNASGNKSYITMGEIGSGIYEGSLEGVKPGDYSFSGSAVIGEKTAGIETGRFNVGDVDIEMINPGADADYMNRLAEFSGGKPFYNTDEGLAELLRRREAMSVKEKTTATEYDVWASNLLLILVIIFLGIEWFLRKREGML